MARSSRLGAGMTQAEQICGWCYLPFYVVLLGLILSYLVRLLDLSVSTLTLNFAYTLINFSLTLRIFHRCLYRSLCNIPQRFWLFIQAIILGFVFYFALNWLLGIVLLYLAPGLQNPNDGLVSIMADTSYGLTLVCTVLLAPLVEETLVRGLLFGTIARRHRILAYLISMLFFAAIHTWQYALLVPWQTLLLSALQYLPAGVALGWTYEKAGNIWAPFLVHAFINALSMGLQLF